MRSEVPDPLEFKEPEPPRRTKKKQQQEEASPSASDASESESDSDASSSEDDDDTEADSSALPSRVGSDDDEDEEGDFSAGDNHGGDGEARPQSLQALLDYSRDIPEAWTTTETRVSEHDAFRHYDTDLPPKARHVSAEGGEEDGEEEEEADPEMAEAYKRCLIWNAAARPEAIYHAALDAEKHPKGAVAREGVARRFAVVWPKRLAPEALPAEQTVTLDLCAPLPDGAPLSHVVDLAYVLQSQKPVVPLLPGPSKTAALLDSLQADPQWILPLEARVLALRNTTPVPLRLELQGANLDAKSNREAYAPLAGAAEEEEEVRMEGGTLALPAGTQPLLHQLGGVFVDNPEFLRWGGITPQLVEKSIRKSKRGTFVAEKLRPLTRDERALWVQEKHLQRQMLLGAELDDVTDPRNPVKLKALSKSQKKKLKKKAKKGPPLEELARAERKGTGVQLLNIPLLASPAELAQVIAVGYAHAIVRQCALEGTPFKVETDAHDPQKPPVLVMHLETFLNVVRRYCAHYDLRRAVTELHTLRFAAVPKHRLTLLSHAAHAPTHPTSLEARVRVSFVRLPARWRNAAEPDATTRALAHARAGKETAATLDTASKAVPVLEACLAAGMQARWVAKAKKASWAAPPPEVRATHAHQMPQPGRVHPASLNPTGLLTRT